MSTPRLLEELAPQAKAVLDHGTREAIGRFMAHLLAKLHKQCLMTDAAEERLAELEAENAALRSRQGADDAEPLTYAWLDATIGEEWEIINAYGMRVDIFNEGISEAEPRYEAKISCKARKITVSTRGDVRRLVAALGGAEREEQK